MKTSIRWKFLAAVLTYAVLCKVLPYVLHRLNEAGVPIDPRSSWYPWNFSPFWAVFAFCGAIVPTRRWAIALPLTMMLASDMLIYLVHGNQFFRASDWLVQASVYASFALCGGLGLWIRKRVNWVTGISAALPGALVFYLTTNLAVWAFGNGEFYPETLDGLWACYVAGLPFLRTSLISTAIYAGLFFSPWGLALAGVTPIVSPATEPACEVVPS
jgi:hypothetical protein